ncbi:MAG: UvrD-helicase domain-containing protein, partial [Planctomycetaceae bacterium]|nr:UvrD-helicase domain-containing protein [Planctomycetaceae bacterium]
TEADQDDLEDDRDFLAAVAYRKYQKSLRAAGAVDFDDLLLLTLQLFRGFPEVLARQQQRFDHVQIDEYQDTNAIQFELIDQLVRPHQSLCVVGDDDQSIYGWRGAEVEHILGFQKHFPGAKVVRLQDNYRCTDQILELANTLVRHNRSRHEKTLVSHRPSRTDVRSISFDSEVAEAEHVVREIAREVREQRAAPGDFAILYRTNEQPRVFEQELRRQNIPYLLQGGQSFFDRREIRDILAYLKVIASPADEMSLLRIINTPARGIGQSTVTKLLEQAVARGCSLWDVIPDAVAAGTIPPKIVSALNTFRGLLERYRQKFQAEPSRMADHVQSLLDEIDYESEIGRQYKEPAMQLARSASLGQIVDAVQQFVDQTNRPDLIGFLEETALDGRDELHSESREENVNAVRMMTLHSAKGLEFPNVYLVGMEEGLLPHRRSRDEGTESAIAEERRLCYVGITRARDQLTLTRARTRMKWGKKKPTLPSRFLFEMREEFTGDDAGDEEESDSAWSEQNNGGGSGGYSRRRR